MRELVGIVAVAVACAVGGAVAALADSKPPSPSPSPSPTEKPAPPSKQEAGPKQIPGQRQAPATSGEAAKAGAAARPDDAKPGDAKPGDAKPGAPTKLGAPVPAPDLAGAPASTNDLIIGAYLSLTGPEAPFGIAISNGITLAVDEQNRAGGVRGRKIVLRMLDTMGRVKDTADVAARLVTKERAVALLGEITSRASIAGGGVAQQLGVPMITPAATNRAVTEVGDMVSRACILDEDQAAAMASFARGRLKLSRVAMLYDGRQPYSTEMADHFRKAFAKLGGTIAAAQEYTSTDPADLQPRLEAIRDAKPQAIFVPVFYSDAAELAKRLRALGVRAPLLGTDGWDSPQLAQLAGAAIDGGYYSGHFAADDPRPATRDFVQRYRAKYQEAPDSLAALGYDAARLLFDAMARARSLGGKDLAAAIAATKRFEGATGAIAMTPERNPKKPAVIVQLKAGKPVFAATIAPP